MLKAFLSVPWPWIALLWLSCGTTVLGQEICDNGGYAFYFIGMANNKTLVSKGLISLVR